MNKKMLGFFILLVSVSLAVFGFNPSNGGENLYQFATPETLTDGASVAGGALPYTSSAHIAINPALTANEQRIALNFGFTGLIAPKSENNFGFATHLGTVIPSKYGVFTGSLYCISSEIDYFDFGTSFTTRLGFAKDTPIIITAADFAIPFRFRGQKPSDLPITDTYLAEKQGYSAKSKSR